MVLVIIFIFTKRRQSSTRYEVVLLTVCIEFQCINHHAICNAVIQDPKVKELIPIKDVAIDYHVFKVDATCELRKFVESKNLKFKRGDAFYEFTCAAEDISACKEVLLKDKVAPSTLVFQQILIFFYLSLQATGEFFKGAAAFRAIGAPGKGIPRPNKDFKYVVFVQNRSRGSRCLMEGSTLLYRKEHVKELL